MHNRTTKMSSKPNRGKVSGKLLFLKGFTRRPFSHLGTTSTFTVKQMMSLVPKISHIDGEVKQEIFVWNELI